MKRLILIVSLILCLTCTGCGVFNLSGFLPDDLEFLAVVESLKSPEEICTYMADKNNFTYKAYLFYAPDPYTFWKLKEGDCNDFATFGTFVANFNNRYETYTILIYYKGRFVTHMIGIYIEDKMSYSENWIYCYGFNSFREIVEDDMRHRPSDWEWSKYTVYDYNMNVILREYK